MAKKQHEDRKRPRLSLCMIVKNEARFLRNCLDSVQGVVDEIIVVDTGSTDGTQSIARFYGATVIEHEWNNDFSEARNISLRHATGDWALWLDADEEIAPEAKDKFRTAIEKAPKNIGAFLVRINNWMSNLNRAAGGERIVHHAGRLFRLTPQVYFVGRIHEQNLSSILKLGYETAKAPHLILDHYGYVPEISNEKKKSERTISLLTREVEERLIPELHGFQCFNLGLAYSVSGDNENAAKYFGMSAERPDAGQQYVEWLFAHYVIVQQQRGLPEEGLKVCAQADSIGAANQPGLEFGRGQCLHDLRRYEEAVTAFRAALAMGADPVRQQDNVGDVGLGSFKARFALAITLTELERYAEALAECDLVLAEQEAMPAAHCLRADMLTRLGRLSEAVVALRRALDFNAADVMLLRALGMVLLGDGKAEEALPYLEQTAQQFPDDYDSQARFAEALNLLGKLPEAQIAYERLTELQPGSSEVRVNLGRLLAQQGQPQAALNHFADAIEINPHDANAYFNAGDMLYQLANYPQAAECYRVGLGLRPDFASGHFTLGNACFQMGDYDTAAASYRRSLMLAPDNDRAALNLALTEQQVEIAA